MTLCLKVKMICRCLASEIHKKYLNDKENNKKRIRKKSRATLFNHLFRCLFSVILSIIIIITKHHPAVLFRDQRCCPRTCCSLVTLLWCDIHSWTGWALFMTDLWDYQWSLTTRSHWRSPHFNFPVTYADLHCVSLHGLLTRTPPLSFSCFHLYSAASSTPAALWGTDWQIR